MSLYKQPVSDQRIAFEAWYSNSHTSVILARTSKGYIDNTTRVAWRAWQAAVVSGVDSAAVLQLFTDPENQPTQYGTVTVEYMQREIAAEREACAKLIEAHGPTLANGAMLAEEIRARGQA